MFKLVSLRELMKTAEQVFWKGRSRSFENAVAQNISQGFSEVVPYFRPP